MRQADIHGGGILSALRKTVDGRPSCHAGVAAYTASQRPPLRRLAEQIAVARLAVDCSSLRQTAAADRPIPAASAGRVFRVHEGTACSRVVVTPVSGTFLDEHGNNIGLGIIGLLVLALVPSVFALVMAIARNRTTHYRVSNQRIIIESGLFSRSLEEIDMRSVDDIEFRQSFLERVFGIGEIAIVSTDKVAPRRRLHGIHDPRNTRELIRSAAYQLTQRQLFTRST